MYWMIEHSVGRLLQQDNMHLRFPRKKTLVFVDDDIHQNMNNARKTRYKISHSEDSTTFRHSTSDWDIQSSSSSARIPAICLEKETSSFV